MAEEKTLALKLLRALADGAYPVQEAAFTAEELDPVSVYVIVSYLRNAYSPSESLGGAIVERVAGMMSKSKQAVAKHREGKSDPITEWFESEYNYRDFRGRSEELVDLIVDKLES